MFRQIVLTMELPSVFRPRFEMQTEVTALEVAQAVKDALSDQTIIAGRVRSDFIHLHHRSDLMEIWSPHMTASLEEDQGHCLIRGHYGPAPSLWTLFVFGYTALGLAAMIIGIIGFANKSLGEPYWILWLLPLIILGMIGMYLVSRFGQQRSSHQIHEIHEILQQAVPKTKLP